MAIFKEIVLYLFLFVGLYFQVFILFTFLSNRKRIKHDACQSFERTEYPSVTIVIPAWNEEHTVSKTIQSVLDLNYPSDKLKLMVVDDGSTDTTWSVMQHYKNHPQVELYHKENGGKHTAVNYAIVRTTSELIGCLDADSFVDKDSLKKIACKFENPDVMAVTPAMKIHNPRTIIQLVQSADYIFGILIKKVMAIVGAIHVTPGPFTIFRRSLFDKIGLLKKAHNTEDMEIAFRMQANRMTIENVHNAWVYTTGPATIKKLYKQRLRWTYGFLQNVRDYKFLLFNKKYGNIGFLTLPIITALIIGVIFTTSLILYRLFIALQRLLTQWRAVGIALPQPEISAFYISGKIYFFLFLIVIVLMTTLILSAYRLAGEKILSMKAAILYMLLFPILSPFWVLKSIYNVIVSQTTTWR